MSEWKEFDLGELCDFTTGKLNSNAAVEEGCYPFFTCSPETLRINNFAFDREALLLAGNNANAIYSLKNYKGKFNAYQRTYVITIKNENTTSYKYLFYMLNLKLNYLKEISQGTATKFLTVRILNEILIDLPDYKEQKAIASILSSLDSKIDLLRRQNQTLENIAQTLFKHWFVDFEFPDKDGKPYKSSGGKMVESELGDIPEGWKALDFQSLFSVKDGTHDSPKQAKKGYPLVTSRHLTTESIDFKSTYLISEKDYIEINKRSKVDQCDILLSMIGTIGLLYFVQESNINYSIKNIGLFKTSEMPQLSEFIFLYLCTPFARYYLKTRLSGTTQEYVTLGSLREFPVIIPDSKCLDKFNKIIKPIFKLRYLNILQIQTLIKTRDTLLPKLMSGQIIVKN